MATGTSGSTAHRDHTQNVQTIMERITFSSPGTTVAKVIGVLPAGALVVGGGIFVTTAFNGGGSDLIDIGTSGDVDEFGSAIDISSVGYKALDEVATQDGYSTGEVTVQAIYTDASANATAGAGFVFINFVIPSNWGF